MKQLTYEQADPRAQKFFQRVFVGTSVNGTDSSGRQMSWDSDHKELVGTPHHECLHTRYCAFCGATSLPIQANLNKVGFTRLRSDDDYRITGWTCVCEKAMDWLDIAAQVEILKERHEQEMEELLSTRPAFDQQISVSLLRKASDYKIKQFQKGWSHDFSGLGVKLAEQSE